MRVVIDFIVFSRDEYRLVVSDDAKNEVLVWIRVLKLHKIPGKKVLKYLIDFYSDSYKPAFLTEKFKSGVYTILWEKEVELKD